jgi:hypothetical protein
MGATLKLQKLSEFEILAGEIIRDRCASERNDRGIVYITCAIDNDWGAYHSLQGTLWL